MAKSATSLYFSSLYLVEFNWNINIQNTPKMHLGDFSISRLATSTMRTHSTNFGVPSSFSVHSTEFTVRVSVLTGALRAKLLGFILRVWPLTWPNVFPWAILFRVYWNVKLLLQLCIKHLVINWSQRKWI